VQSVRSIKSVVQRSLSDLRTERKAATRAKRKLPVRNSDDSHRVQSLMGVHLDASRTEGVVHQNSEIVLHASPSDIEQVGTIEVGAMPIMRNTPPGKFVTPQEPLDLDDLEDWEITTSLPLVLDTLHINALQSILATLISTPVLSKNRTFMEDQIIQIIATHLEQGGDDIPEVVSRAIDVIRDKKSVRKRISDLNLCALPSSPIAATYRVLEHLEFLPLRTLHAMKDLLKSQTAQSEQTVFGSNRTRLASYIRRKVAKQLGELDEGDPFPEAIKSSMYALSLSVKEVGGDDGDLGLIIGPPLPSVVSVHNKIFSALRKLKRLKFKSLLSLSSFIGDGVDCQSKKQTISVRARYRQILVDFLLRCEEPIVPDAIKRLVDAIAELEQKELELVKRIKQPKPRGGKTAFQKWRRVPEVEAVLRVSSHLKNIHRDEEVKEARAVVPSEEELIELGVSVVNGQHSFDVVAEGQEELVGVPENRRFMEAADEAGELCYMLLGRALAGIALRRNKLLPMAVQKYLSTGLEETMIAGAQPNLGSYFYLYILF
jgi:hypothetical protein